jgi:Ca2+/Na+ antiporter
MPIENNGLKRNLFPLLFGFFIIVASVRAPEFWFLYLILCFFLGYVLWWRSKVHLVKDKLIRHRIRAILICNDRSNSAK